MKTYSELQTHNAFLEAENKRQRKLLKELYQLVTEGISPITNEYWLATLKKVSECLEPHKHTED